MKQRKWKEARNYLHRQSLAVSQIIAGFIHQSHKDESTKGNQTDGDDDEGFELFLMERDRVLSHFLGSLDNLGLEVDKNVEKLKVEMLKFLESKNIF